MKQWMQCSANLGIAAERGLELDQAAPSPNGFWGTGMEVAGPMISLDNEHLAARAYERRETGERADRIV
jgi:hypothetical protein